VLPAGERAGREAARCDAHDHCLASNLAEERGRETGGEALCRTTARPGRAGGTRAPGRACASARGETISQAGASRPSSVNMRHGISVAICGTNPCKAIIK